MKILAARFDTPCMYDWGKKWKKVVGENSKSCEMH